MSIWVEELPRGCQYCDYEHMKDYDYRERLEGERFCGIENLELHGYRDYENPRKPEWCPLRELPKKLVTEYSNAGNQFRNGWNACLDKILENE